MFAVFETVNFLDAEQPFAVAVAFILPVMVTVPVPTHVITPVVEFTVATEASELEYLALSAKFAVAV